MWEQLLVRRPYYSNTNGDETRYQIMCKGGGIYAMEGCSEQTNIQADVNFKD
jgi:hypothetical protein